jgi:hypothetical protein
LLTSNVTVIGDVGGSGQVRFDYSFTYLAIASSGQLWLYNGTTLAQVTDVDLGTVVDMLWVDGYFMTTDGTNLVVTELNDPFSVSPLKYGSSEVDPDKIVGLQKLHNEVYAVNRYTIEIFNDVGGDFFPFQRINGAQLQRGSVGTFASCIFQENLVFLGSGRNESPAVWAGINSSTTKISNREIDQILSQYSETVLASTVIEGKIDQGSAYLYIHLLDRTLVYDAIGSQASGVPVWFVLCTSMVGEALYKARNFVWCYDKWIVGDPSSSAFGYFTNKISSHWGNAVGWEISTQIMYNESKAVIYNSIELVCLTGRESLTTDTVVFTSYSIDGVVWSQERSCTIGVQGNRNKNIVWFRQGYTRNWRIQKFRGSSDAHISIVSIDIDAEPLNF